jgi:hypothetical protein
MMNLRTRPASWLFAVLACLVCSICLGEYVVGSGTSFKLSGGYRVLEYDTTNSGDRAVFLALGQFGSEVLYSVSSAGGPLTRLSDNSGPDILWWGVAGDTGSVNFSIEESSIHDALYEVPITGGEYSRIAEANPVINVLGLTGDGGWLAYKCGEVDSTRAGLCTLPSAGGETRVHLMLWDDEGYRWYGGVLFSPVGSSIVYTLVPRYPDFDPFYMHRKVLSGEGSGGGTSSMWGSPDPQFEDDGDWMLYRRWDYENGQELWGNSLFSGSFMFSQTDHYNDSVGTAFDMTNVPVEGALRVVYTFSDADGPDPTGMYQVPVGGGERQFLLAKRPSTLEISPDGAYVVYDDPDTSTPLDLHRVPVLGGTPLRLTPPPPAGGEVLDFDFSPDGRWLIYRLQQGAGGPTDLFAVAVAGGVPRRLNGPLDPGQAVTLDYLPTPDSRFVIYLADEERPSWPDLYIVPIEAGAPSRLSVDLLPTRYVRPGVRLSPDGSHVFYLADDTAPNHLDLFATALDLDGDGRYGADDCAPIDGTAWELPGMVQDLTLSHAGGPDGTTSLGWTPPTPHGGTELLYDVLRGDRPDGLEVWLDGVAETDVEDPGEPDPGFYYRVRGRNACGPGPIGGP